MFNNVQRGANMANNIQQTAILPAEGYVRLPQVLAVIPVCKSTWWNGIRAGKYPKPVKLGPRTTVWRVSDIREMIQSLEGR